MYHLVSVNQFVESLTKTKWENILRFYELTFKDLSYHMNSCILLRRFVHTLGENENRTVSLLN